jgi:leucyl aminopeptidase
MPEYYQPLFLSVQVNPDISPDLTVILRSAPKEPQLGEPGKTTGDILLREASNGERTALVSLGSQESISQETFRQAGGAVARWLKGSGAQYTQIDTHSMAELKVDGSISAFLEGLYLGAYQFDQYKRNSQPTRQVVVSLTGGDELVDLITHTEALTRAVNLARSWAHEPANIINPLTLSQRAVDLGQQYDLKVSVFDEKALAEMGAGGLISVGKGSRSQPRLIVIDYPRRSQHTNVPPVVLVGKAITFDTGGYSMKDVTNIQGMKYDKCGGVTVAAVMQAVAELKLDLPVVGIIAAAENMVSADAYRPDDILTMMSGKTVEIVSTDAEGRLILADALHYAQKHYQPRAMIDLATLTGGIVTALGRVRAGIFSNHDDLANRLIQAGERTHERLWRMPLDDDYLANIKGDDADLKNSGGREGHPIFGGIFLKQFVSDEIPWAHLDIAGVADSPKDLPYSPKGATGFGVRLLISYLESLAAGVE